VAIDTITIEEREFPSNRLINKRTEQFDFEGSGTPYPRPYRIALSPFTTEFDVGVGMPVAATPGPLPTPWGPAPSRDLPFYSYLFTIWHEDWMSDLQRDFPNIYPREFKAYYLAMDSGVDAGSVHMHAVSLQTLRVLESSPVSDFRDGVVSTTKQDRKVTASPLLRAREPTEKSEFVEWTAWTNPATATAPPSTGVLTRVEPRMTLKRGATGRAIAFYKRHPDSPGRKDPPAEELRLDLPFEERIRRVAEDGDLDSARRAARDIDKRLAHLGLMRDLLQRRLEKADSD
jgi:hypothetical protein